MSVVAAIRQMLAAGLTVDQALTAAEAFEAQLPPPAKPKTPGAIRQDRYRQKMVASQSVTVASQTSQSVTSDESVTNVTEVTEVTPAVTGDDPAAPAAATLPLPSHTLPLSPIPSEELVVLRTADAVVKPLTPLDRLWIEGVPIMVSMGIADSQCRKLIGRWLKSSADVPLTVLDAIQRARDHGVVEPVAWITRSLSEQPRRERPRNDLTAAFDRLDARIARREGAASFDDGPQLDLDVAEGLPRLAGSFR